MHSGWSGVVAVGVGGSSLLEAGGEGVAFTKLTRIGILKEKQVKKLYKKYTELSNFYHKGSLSMSSISSFWNILSKSILSIHSTSWSGPVCTSNILRTQS